MPKFPSCVKVLRGPGIHDDDAVGKGQFNVLPAIPAETRRDHVAVGAGEHGRFLVAGAVRLVGIGEHGRPVFGEVPGRGDGDAVGVDPVEVDGRDGAAEIEVERVERRPLRPGKGAAEVPGVGDVPVEAAGDRLGHVEIRGGAGPAVDRALGLRLAVHIDIDHRLVDEADGEVVEKPVARANLPAPVAEVVVAFQPIADPARNRVRILLEVKVEETKARADRPAVGDGIGEVRVEGKALDGRFQGAVHQRPVVVVFRAESALDIRTEAKGEPCRQGNGQLKMGEPEDPWVHG